MLRSTIAPAAAFSSNAAMFLIMIGFFLNFAGLVKVACVLFGVSVLFTLITLPVEFDASWRALGQLETLRLTGGEEYVVARKVLVAAAMTYVAAAVAAMLQLLYFVLLARNDRRR
jgi:Zn-dependent membrane protease YugP